MGRTLGEHFELIAKQEGDKCAVVDKPRGLRLSYAELNEKANKFARGLMKLGIVQGDRVGIWSTNNVEWIITQLATAKIGAILVNINPAYRVHELEYALLQSGVKLLVLIPGFKGDEYLEMLRQLAPELITEAKDHTTVCPDLKQLILIDPKSEYSRINNLLNFDVVCELGDTVPPEDLVEVSESLQFDDAINIQYTSGTTGFPKGVTLSHHNLLNNSLYGAEAMGINRDSRMCIPMPFYHCGGMVIGTLSTLCTGAQVVIPAPSFNPEKTMEAVQAERCTHLIGVPTMFIEQLEHPRFSEFDFSSLRSGFMAGAPCPVELMRQVQTKMNLTELVIIYGQTECSPIITSTTASDPLELRATSVGKVIPHLEIKIVDPETGKTVAIGEQGEICSRGYAVMLGYWMNENATKESVDLSGWLHTGDLGKMDTSGYVHITGRKKDMIIRGGENIYPREIEEVLHGHSAIAQAQVFGIPDKRLGEEVACWLQAKTGVAVDTQDVKLWLKERVAYFKIPTHFKVVQEFPMTVTGKVQKHMMREMMIKELGLEAVANIETA